MISTRSVHLSLVAAGLLAAGAATASATTINSFTGGALTSGISVTPNVGSPNLNFTVTLDAGALLTFDNVTFYHIERIIGFYLLAPGFNDTNQANLGPVPPGFTDDSDSRAAGSIYGWRSNPNSGIVAGGSQAFSFPSIAYPNYTTFGFHIYLRADEFFPGTTGNTGNITGVLGAQLPTPGAAALLGLAGLMSSRRRR